MYIYNKELLLKEIFANNDQPQSKKEVYTWLLAYATSVNDGDDAMVYIYIYLITLIITIYLITYKFSV